MDFVKIHNNMSVSGGRRDSGGIKARYPPLAKKSRHIATLARFLSGGFMPGLCRDFLSDGCMSGFMSGFFGGIFTKQDYKIGAVIRFRKVENFDIMKPGRRRRRRTRETETETDQGD